MIAIFLPPFAFRGVAAPYLWVFYKFLKPDGEKKIFIIGEEYLLNHSGYMDTARWEFLDSSQQRLKYSIPHRDELKKHHVDFLSQEIFEHLLRANNFNPCEVFRLFLTSTILELMSEIGGILDKYGDSVEAVVTWCNCPSLNKAAELKNIPVIHLELGPLRAPDYKPTMYLDFSGVNGNTEATSRYESTGLPPNMSISTHRLLNYFLSEPQALRPPQSLSQALRVGVVLQVEDDSNLIAFGNGFDNRALLSYVQLNVPLADILVRSHPGSLFQIKQREFAVDNSENSISYIAKCRKIITINSSVGLEALLQSRSVQVLGDCSYKFVAEAETEFEKNNRLAFYLFCYLVPAELGFDLGYLRFRMETKDEMKIAEFHIRYYSSRRLGALNKGSLNKMIESEISASEIERLALMIDDLNKKVQVVSDELCSKELHLLDVQTQMKALVGTFDDQLLSLSKRLDDKEQLLLAAQKQVSDLLDTLDKHLRDAAERSDNEYIQSVAAEKMNGVVNALEKQLQDATRQLTEKDHLLSMAHIKVQKLLGSRSWRMTWPFRFVGNQAFRGMQIIKALVLSKKYFGSIWVLLKKTSVIYRREGIAGLRARIKYVLVNASQPGTVINVENVKARRSKAIVRHTVSVDIIVCVHNALTDVRNCLESIAAYTLPPYRLIIVDDGSERETHDYLTQYAAAQHCLLHRNEAALGYTLAANCGLRLSDADYVVLLNSDTIVSPYWLDRLLGCAESDVNVGIVGPLSNTASWQSVPEVFDSHGDWLDNPLPSGMTIQDFANEIARESMCIYPNVGFVNGFCLLVKRGLIVDIGIFDEETFAQGYGEENDFCLRAAEKGWKLAIADDVYIHHAHSRSYSHERRATLSKAADIKLANKHGQRLIDQQLNITVNHPALHYIRRRASLITQKINIRNQFLPYQGKRLLFLLPVRTMGGGGNIILLEIDRLIKLGVDVLVVNLLPNKQIFEQAHADNAVPIYYISSPDELHDIAKYFDAIVATLYLTVEWMRPIAEISTGQIFAYYIQDFEPDFFSEGSPEYVRALKSYTLIEGLKLITKTGWNRDALYRALGVECDVIGADYDDNEFYPGAVCRSYGGIVTIAAMIRPATPRRAPELTMRVLKRLKSEFGKAIEIRTFGTSINDVAYHELSADFEHECLGELQISQVSELLKMTDIFLDFSSFQAMGLTAMEAAACGAVTVGPINGGLQEIIIDHETGILIDALNEDECFFKARDLICNAQLRSEIRKNAMSITRLFPEQVSLNLMISLFGKRNVEY